MDYEMEHAIVGMCAARILYHNVDIETVLEDALSQLGHTKKSAHYPFAKETLRDLIHQKLNPYDCLVEELSKHHNVTEISEESYNLGNFPPIKSEKYLEKPIKVVEVWDYFAVKKSKKGLEKQTKVAEVQDLVPVGKSKKQNRKDRRKAKK